jgi:hypothetical protein
MEFRITDKFTDSLACLTGGEQNAVKGINQLGDEAMNVLKA